MKRFSSTNVLVLIGMLLLSLLMLITIINMSPSENIRMAELGYAKVYYKVGENRTLFASWLPVNGTLNSVVGCCECNDGKR